MEYNNAGYTARLRPLCFELTVSKLRRLGRRYIQHSQGRSHACLYLLESLKGRDPTRDLSVPGSWYYYGSRRVTGSMAWTALTGKTVHWSHLEDTVQSPKLLEKSSAPWGYYYHYGGDDQYHHRQRRRHHHLTIDTNFRILKILRKTDKFSESLSQLPWYEAQTEHALTKLRC
jgi:hypothetical protein